MNTVLITGGAGFLGRHFVRRHLADGDQVTVVDHSTDEWPFLGDAKTVQCDAADWLNQDDEDYDIVYHFAAPVGGRMKIEGDPLFNADSLRLDSVFFRWAVKHVGIAVYPSSSAVYGTLFQNGYGQMLQEGMFHPDNPNWFPPDQMYGFTKFTGEYLAWQSAKRYGLNTLCIRPFSGYGEGQSMDYPVPSICRRAKNQEDPLTIWGSGHQKRDFIHVDDIVGATLARLEAGIKGYESMNISSGQATSFVQIARGAANIVGYEPTIVTDESKPEGVHARWGDNQKMYRYYGEPRVSLTRGLKRVMESIG